MQICFTPGNQEFGNGQLEEITGRIVNRTGQINCPIKNGMDISKENILAVAWSEKPVVWLLSDYIIVIL